jgi:NADP-dependent alcohol dehydrogenase
VDAFVHVTEQYVTYPADAPLVDRMAESVLQTLVEAGPHTLPDSRDYAGRASLMWSATMALNGVVGVGVPEDWATHELGHELTALYGIDHAESLAVVLPGVWTVEKERKRAKLEQYGQRVFAVSGADAAIEQTEAFFRSLGMPLRLQDYGIDADDAARKVSHRMRQRKLELGERRTITPDVVAELLRLRA